MTALADATDPQLAHLARFEAAVAPPEVTEAAVRDLARVISDPGSVLPRQQFMRGEYETVPTWAARAVLAHLPAAAYRAAQDGGAEEAVLVEGDWIVPSREAHARDLTKSWADAAQNAGCPASFVARMRAFV